tara:strand:+ start:1587 stop:1814 length:228 start_codon:yes stop_codon:yes gene_type:complete
VLTRRSRPTALQLRRVLWDGNRYAYTTFDDMYDLTLYLGYMSVLSLLQVRAKRTHARARAPPALPEPPPPAPRRV